jgi:hypothetical protein
MAAYTYTLTINGPLDVTSWPHSIDGFGTSSPDGWLNRLKTQVDVNRIENSETNTHLTTYTKSTDDSAEFSDFLTRNKLTDDAVKSQIAEWDSTYNITVSESGGTLLS